MKKLEEQLTEKFYNATKLKDLSKVHASYVRFRKYALENEEHDNQNFADVTRTYVEYITSSNLHITLDLEDERINPDWTARWHW